MSNQNDVVALPVSIPNDYEALSVERLQCEINFCISALEVVTLDEAVTFYKKRLLKAESELERRFLLS